MQTFSTTVTQTTSKTITATTCPPAATTTAVVQKANCGENTQGYCCTGSEANNCQNIGV